MAKADDVEEIWVGLVLGHDGRWGVPGVMMHDGGFVPLVAWTDGNQRTWMRQCAQRIANDSGEEVRVVRFSSPEMVETLLPEQDGVKARRVDENDTDRATAIARRIIELTKGAGEIPFHQAMEWALEAQRRREGAEWAAAYINAGHTSVPGAMRPD